MKSPEKYFLYIKQELENIITDYDMQYTEIQDDRKIYPKFTKKQFMFIAQTLNDRIYKPNIMLLKDNIYNFRYDISKVELCYTVFSRLCMYYSITPTIEIFAMFSGVDQMLLREWLNTGKSQLLKRITSDIDNIDNFSMLNSENSLLRVYYRNNREVERTQEQNTNILPDLLQTDHIEKQLTVGENPENA